MCLHYLEGILDAVAQPYDERIDAFGHKLEAGLSPEQTALLERLDEAHWDRAGALVEKTFQVAIELGITIGRNHPIEAPFNPSEGS